MRHAADEAAIAVDHHVGDVQAVIATVVVAQMDFHLVGGVVFLGLGVEGVQRAGPAVVGPELQGCHHAIALGMAGAAQGLDAVGVIGAFRHAGAPVVTNCLPRLIQADLVFLLGHLRVGNAHGQADGVVGELVDIAEIEAVAIRVFAGGFAQRVLLVAAADGDDALVVAERAHGLQVQRAGQALANQACVGGLVDGDAADQFGRVLVELHRAVVAGADHLAAVEQGGGEVGRQAAHADHLGAASDALGSQAGQAGDGFGDADVGQLADVFGRDGFHDRGRVALDRNRTLDAAADAGNGDGIQVGGLGLCFCSGLVVHALRVCGGCAQRDGRSQCNAQQVALVVQHTPLSQVMSVGCFSAPPHGCGGCVALFFSLLATVSHGNQHARPWRRPAYVFNGVQGRQIGLKTLSAVVLDVCTGKGQRAPAPLPSSRHLHWRGK